jgi:hypothetical protein
MIKGNNIMKELDVNSAVFTTAKKPDYLQGKMTGGCDGSKEKSMSGSAKEMKTPETMKESKGPKVEY